MLDQTGKWKIISVCDLIPPPYLQYVRLYIKTISWTVLVKAG